MDTNVSICELIGSLKLIYLNGVCTTSHEAAWYVLCGIYNNTNNSNSNSSTTRHKNDDVVDGRKFKFFYATILDTYGSK